MKYSLVIVGILFCTLSAVKMESDSSIAALNTDGADLRGREELPGTPALTSSDKDGASEIADAIAWSREAGGRYTTLAIAREMNIERLHAYAERGRFPRNTRHAKRTPIFIDESGTHCAVGQLMADSGAEESARAIAAMDNHIRVMAAPEGPLTEWIQTSGLSQEECARIQPTYGPSQEELDHGAEMRQLRDHFETVERELRLAAETRLLATMQREVSAATRPWSPPETAHLRRIVDERLGDPASRLGALLALHLLDAAPPESRTLARSDLLTSLARAMRDDDSLVRHTAASLYLKTRWHPAVRGGSEVALAAEALLACAGDASFPLRRQSLFRALNGGHVFHSARDEVIETFRPTLTALHQSLLADPLLSNEGAMWFPWRSLSKNVWRPAREPGAAPTPSPRIRVLGESPRRVIPPATLTALSLQIPGAAIFCGSSAAGAEGDITLLHLRFAGDPDIRAILTGQTRLEQALRSLAYIEICKTLPARSRYHRWLDESGWLAVRLTEGAPTVPYQAFQVEAGNTHNGGIEVWSRADLDALPVEHFVQPVTTDKSVTLLVHVASADLSKRRPQLWMSRGAPQGLWDTNDSISVELEVGD